MPASANYLAIDLGASGGRAVVGSFDGRRLALREVHRFPNGPIRLPTGMHWDTPRLFDEIKRSLTLATRGGTPLTGVGIDAWGVDYALLSPGGEMLHPPYHYRDPRTHGMMAEAFHRVPRDRIYGRTGIQFLPFNTLYQLLADRHAPTAPLDAARSLLFIPDLLHFWLTGVQRSERTIASTSQLLDAASGTWDAELVGAFGLPAQIFPEVSPPGTPLGPLRSTVAAETGAAGVTVIPPACHDTASAVAAVPAVRADEWAYISSGTWSLVGRELTTPIRTPEALAENFTNECGVTGTFRFHKNVAGLWLLQECQRSWSEQGRPYTFEALCGMAAECPGFAALIDPDDPSLADYGDMPERIRGICRRTGQPAPVSDGALVRCILESLAFKYRLVIESLERLTGRPVRTIHIVGGGAQNALLCQLAADATGREVLAGPVEAAAAGNVLVQAMAHRRIASLAELRAVVAASFPPAHYAPHDITGSSGMYDRFRSLLST